MVPGGRRSGGLLHGEVVQERDWGELAVSATEDAKSSGEGKGEGVGERGGGKEWYRGVLPFFLGAQEPQREGGHGVEAEGVVFFLPREWGRARTAAMTLDPAVDDNSEGMAYHVARCPARPCGRYLLLRVACHFFLSLPSFLPSFLSFFLSFSLSSFLSFFLSSFLPFFFFLSFFLLSLLSLSYFLLLRSSREIALFLGRCCFVASFTPQLVPL